MSSSKLGEFVKAYNAKLEEEAKEAGTDPVQLKQRGASSLDLPPAIMQSFFRPLFNNIKEKVREII